VPTPPLPRSPDPAPPPERAAVAPRLLHRDEDGGRWPFLVWRFAEPRRTISSAPVGGGLGERDWVLNAQVRSGYARYDLAVHLDELADRAGVAPGGGVGLLTAADVTGAVSAADGGVDVLATVGIRVPTWAAAPEGEPDPIITPHAARAGGARSPGTINIVVQVPVPMSDAALVNLVATVTEAKAQALLERGIPGTGTATDAVCVVCPRPAGDPLEPFGGPRSTWGARAARATHASVVAGIDGSLTIIGADRPDDPPLGPELAP